GGALGGRRDEEGLSEGLGRGEVADGDGDDGGAVLEHDQQPLARLLGGAEDDLHGSSASTSSSRIWSRRTRTPAAWWTALATAAAVPTMPISPIPFTPTAGSRWGSSSSIHTASMLSTSAYVGRWYE